MIVSGNILRLHISDYFPQYEKPNLDDNPERETLKPILSKDYIATF